MFGNVWNENIQIDVFLLYILIILTDIRCVSSREHLSKDIQIYLEYLYLNFYKENFHSDSIEIISVMLKS